jgi:hypothetical protein
MAGELWSTDLQSGHTEPVLPGVLMVRMTVSPQGDTVAYVTVEGDIWRASLDRRTSPKKLTAGRNPVISASGNLWFEGLEGSKHFLFKLKADGSGRQKMLPMPILRLNGLSPDEKWAAVAMPLPQDPTRFSGRLFPMDGGKSIVLDDRCLMSWTPDGRFVRIVLFGEDTIAVAPVQPDTMIPAFPASKFWTTADLARIRGAQIISHGSAVPSRDPSTYAYVRASAQRNLYRIPLQ